MSSAGTTNTSNNSFSNGGDLKEFYFRFIHPRLPCPEHMYMELYIHSLHNVQLPV